MKVAEPTVERLVQYYRLLGQLHEEGVYEVFSRDLEQALDMHLLGEARPGCASCAGKDRECCEDKRPSVH